MVKLLLGLVDLLSNSQTIYTFIITLHEKESHCSSQAALIYFKIILPSQ